MELIVNGSVVSMDPMAEDVRQALERLPGGDVDSFAILCQRDEFYVQTVGSASDGFHVEYREGSDRTHFVASRDLTLGEVTRLFALYLAGDTDFASGYTWEPLYTRGGRGRAAARLVAMLAMILGGVYFLMLRFGEPWSLHTQMWCVAGLAAGGASWVVLPRLGRGDPEVRRTAFLLGLMVVLVLQVVLGNVGVRAVAIGAATGYLCGLMFAVVRSAVSG